MMSTSIRLQLETVMSRLNKTRNYLKPAVKGRQQRSKEREREDRESKGRSLHLFLCFICFFTSPADQVSLKGTEKHGVSLGEVIALPLFLGFSILCW